MRRILFMSMIFFLLYPAYARATPVSSADMIRIDYQTTFKPDHGGVTGVFYNFTFNVSGDYLNYREGWTVTAYDSTGNKLGSREFVNLDWEYLGYGAIGLGIDFDSSPQPAGGKGYLIFDNIQGSFDLIGVQIDLLYNNLYPLYRIENQVSISPVPEPATMLLLGCGLAGLIGFKRKFKG